MTNTTAGGGTFVSSEGILQAQCVLVHENAGILRIELSAKRQIPTKYDAWPPR
jgi:hypothetical protein